MDLGLAEPMGLLVEPMDPEMAKPKGHLGIKGIVFLLSELS